MLFDFISMQTLYLSLARARRRAAGAGADRRPAVSPDSQWATFVRNHDELTLDKLSDDERAGGVRRLRPDPDMQVYGRGLRRRLPPMLDGDPRRIRMVYSLLFSLPGTPVLFYGEEIGMGEDLDARGPDGRAHADAVDVGRQRRLLPGAAAPAAPAGGDRRLRRPSTSTSPTSAPTPTRCCRS